MDKINKRANLSKWTPTKRRHYAPSSINKGHVLPFIKVAHLVVSLDEEIPVLPILVGIRVSYTSLRVGFFGRKL